MDESLRKNLLSRFKAKILVSTSLFHKGAPCWIWQAAIKKKSGYGSFGFGKRSYSIGAHQAAWRLFRGDVPEGLELDHLCRNRACVNPEHLEPVTDGENKRRGIGGELARQRQLSKTHCPQGHEYTEQNIYRHPGTNFRSCRQCRRDREKALLKGRTIKTHCKNGHEFTPENTYVNKQGWRSCVTCRAAALERFYQRK